MAREQIKVPFGYEQPARSHKGSLLIFETFEDWNEVDMRAMIDFAEARKFVRAIFYPQHEETLRRMGIPCEMPYYARIKLLESMLQEIQSNVTVDVDAWEGKRKKYTPLDTSLHFLTDKYHGPYFIAMSDRYMNLFVTYPSFKEWIKHARFFILPRFGVPLNQKLHDYAERWEVVEMINGV
ncbi:hypothetical protein [Paenibacillus aestuarii]|uniref:DUF4416 family protein n=1 Tax=Paenibacillus aestuarii TaxID=516965 RepID=A0ABW0KIC7_9BACL|nr:hypothetical protein [Paenibacillus aestuarii]